MLVKKGTKITMKDIQDTSRSVILVVDDEYMNRELLTDFLGDQYTVATAAGGKEALAYLQAHHCDLVLLDINMPFMNGFEVLEELRKTYSTLQLPVIVISALAEPHDIVRGLKLGASDYVAKPISPLVVLARIHTQLLLKRYADERQEYIAKLEQAERLRTQLSQIASHDLKNPLNNMRLAYTLLRDTLGDAHKAQAIVETVRVNVEAMQHVIDMFLDIVAIQTDHMTLKFQPFAVRDAVMNVLTQYEVAANRKQIIITYDRLKGYVYGDQKRTVQVLSNLISNAIKYSPPATTVHITVDDHKGQQRIQVIDHGPGIPQSERDQLFQEFARISTQPTGGEDSIGLGLWIVKLLVEKQNGTVGADFPASGGSVFWITLPKADLVTTPE
jgi:two-component system, sensor histidine kinase and response regulator